MNYQEAKLNIVYKGTIATITTLSLDKIDEITSKTISKYDLLKRLVNNTPECIKNDSNVMQQLRYILENYNGYFEDTECSEFCFYISMPSNKKKVALPIIYSNNLNEKGKIFKEIDTNKKITDILKMYNVKFETNNNNKFIIDEIIDANGSLKEDKYIKGDIFGAFTLYEEFLNGNVLLSEEEEKKIKNAKITYRNRSERIHKLINNIDEYQFKKHMLISTIQFFNDELSEENKIIINNGIENHDLTEEMLKELTLSSKVINEESTRKVY